MEWTFAVLLGIAILLLILSFTKTKKATSKVEQEMDQLNLTYTDELYKLKQQMNTIEIDGVITAVEAGVSSVYSEHREKLKEAIDLYRRGYSLESIAIKLQVSTDEMREILAPYAPESKKGGNRKDDSTITS